MITTKDIKDVIHKTPFQPFKLHLADGKSLRVSHPHFIMAAASMAVVAKERDDGSAGKLSLLSYEQIVRIEMPPRRTRKAA